MTGPHTPTCIRPFDRPAARLGPWLVDAEGNRIARDGLEWRVTPKAMFTLRCLMARPQRPVARTLLLDTVWPGTDVGDEVLTQVIAELRRILHDPARGEEAIETIRKVGYRLRVPVEPLDALPCTEATPAGAAHALPIDSKSAPAVPPTSGRAGTGRRIALAASVAVAVAAAAMTPMARRQDAAPLVAWKSPQPLTTDLGSEFAPAVSPDGASVAYLSVAWVDGVMSKTMRVRTLGATSSVVLATAFAGRGDLGPPAWRPDGRRVAFQRIDGPDCQMMSMVVLGGVQPEQELGDCDALEGVLRELHWSPDGTQIAYARHLSPGDAASPVRIHLLDVATGASRAVEYTLAAGESAFPRISPDGATLAFAHGNPGDYGLYAIPLAGGEPRRLAPDTFRVRGFDWLPRGDALVASTREGLWQVGLRDAVPHELGIAGALRPSLARSTPVMVYATPSTSPYNLQRFAPAVPVDGTMPEQRGTVLFASTRLSWSPRWSPDGRAIAFVSDRSGTEQVWIGDPRGGAARVLASLDSGERIAHLAWMPDASALLATVDARDGSGRVVVLATDGSPERQVFDSPIALAAAAPGRDGSLYVATRAPGGSVVHIAGDGAAPTTLPLVDVRSLAVPGDGHVYFGREGDSALYRSDLDGLHVVRLAGTERVRPDSGWAMVSDGIVVWARVEGGEALMRIPRAGAPVPALYSGMVGMFGQYDFAVAPDGSEFVMVAEGAREMDLMLVEAASGR
jgi:Tol biopolymer transport system component/DNA-binding winged helix-turn-helix (wHTH) protein